MSEDSKTKQSPFRSIVCGDTENPLDKLSGSK